MPSIHHTCGSFEYTVIRTRRRTLAIHIHPQRGVIVRSPKSAREKIVREFLMQKAPWVLRKLAEAERRAAEAPRHTFLDGDTLLFMGEACTLRVVEGSGRARVESAGREIILHKGKGTAEEALRRWYVERARHVLLERVEFYSRELGASPARVSVRGQSKRWGSCSARGNINLNWKLIMAPPEVLDYVVAHEVCHLRHPNHGRDFWRAVGGLVPDYEARRNWLRDHGHRLGL